MTDMLCFAYSKHWKPERMYCIEWLIYHNKIQKNCWRKIMIFRTWEELNYRWCIAMRETLSELIRKAGKESPTTDDLKHIAFAKGPDGTCVPPTSSSTRTSGRRLPGLRPRAARAGPGKAEMRNHLEGERTMRYTLSVPGYPRTRPLWPSYRLLLTMGPSAAGKPAVLLGVTESPVPTVTWPSPRSPLTRHSKRPSTGTVDSPATSP